MKTFWNTVTPHELAAYQATPDLAPTLLPADEIFASRRYEGVDPADYSAIRQHAAFVPLLKESPGFLHSTNRICWPL